MESSQSHGVKLNCMNSVWLCLSWNVLMRGELHLIYEDLLWSRVRMGYPQLNPGQDVTIAFVNIRINSMELRDDPVKDSWRLFRCSFLPMCVCRSYWQFPILGLCRISHGGSSSASLTAWEAPRRALCVSRGMSWIEKTLSAEWVKRSREQPVSAPTLKNRRWKIPSPPSEKQEVVGETCLLMMLLRQPLLVIPHQYSVHHHFLKESHKGTT